jgi:DNA polymerase III epsilon subunit-like protein
MVDVETLGSGKNGRIVQIGVVCFDFNEGVLEAHELLQMNERCFNMRVALYPGATEEPGNLAFWLDPKNAEALTEIQRMPEHPLPFVLNKLAKFLSEWLGTRGKLWAKPPQYDLRLLSDAYELAGIERPWHYSHEHDLRTLLYAAKQVPLSGFKAPDIAGAKLVPHYALHDAVEQAVICQAAFRSLSHYAALRARGARDTVQAS